MDRQIQYLNYFNYEKNELFVLNKKRKDDIMSSLLKFIQRNVLNDFKKNKKFTLVRNVKKEFKNEFFKDDKETEKVYYSTLFNRKQLITLKKNKKLSSKIKLSYESKMLETLVDNYFLKKMQKQFFDPRTEKLYSKTFIKSLKKKQMNLGDTLFAFYSIEDHMFNSLEKQEEI